MEKNADFHIKYCELRTLVETDALFGIFERSNFKIDTLNRFVVQKYMKKDS